MCLCGRVFVCMHVCMYVYKYVCTSVRIHIRWRHCESLSSHLQASDSVYLCVSQPSKNENENEHQEKARVRNKNSKRSEFKQKNHKAEHKKVMILYDKNKQKNKITSTGSCIELSWDTIQFFLKSISERMCWISGND